jgi:hypothetical protein
MKPPESHLFRGVEYLVLWRHPRGFPRNVGGACSSPKADRLTIEISPKLYGKQKLRVMIDESIHACLWDLDNDSVAQMSTCISEFLWKSGLRFSERFGEPKSSKDQA